MLNTVELRWDLTDLLGAGLTATLSITPTAQMSDTTDHILIPPAARGYVFTGGTGSLAGIIANDNPDITPAGAGYLISVTSAGKVIIPQFQTRILSSNGPVQWLDQLAVIPSVTTAYQYLPLTTGTPSEGQVPVFTGTGYATEPGSGYLTPTGSGAGLTGITAAQTGAVSIDGDAMDGPLTPKVTTLAPGPAVTIDATLGNTFVLDMDQDTTVTLINPQPGQKIELHALGNGHVLSWAAGTLFGAAGQPSLSGTSWDLLGVEYHPALSRWCVLALAPGFFIPAISWVASAAVQNTGTTGTVTVTVPSQVAVGDLVLIGAGVWEANDTGLSVTVSSAGTTQPQQIGATLPGVFSTYSQMWGFTAAAGDAGAVITVTGAGAGGTYLLSAVIGSWHEAALPQEGDWAATATATGGTNTFTTATVETPVDACWHAEFLLMPVNAGGTTTVPAGLTARSALTNMAIVSDSAGPVGGAGTTIGGGEYTSNEGSVSFHAWVFALRPA
jgi:hypothetical protein